VHEVTIRGGLVVDGSGREPRRADVGIDGANITAIGPDLAGHEVFDASGCLVTPGFIDLHTHYDPQVLWDPTLSPSSQLGVTSVIAGNCGFSIAPCPPASRDSMIATLVNVEDMRSATLHAGIDWSFESYGEYLDTVASSGTTINFGGYVGHTAVRLFVMGDDAYEREATPDEIARMAAVVADSIASGALGFSSDRSPFHRGDGGRLVPSAVATLEEVAALWRAADAAGAGLIHVAPGETYEWVYELQRTISTPVTWSAILAYPPDAVSKAPWASKLERHRAGTAAGSDVHPQVTCRPVTFQLSIADPSSLYMVPAFGTLSALDRAGRVELYRSETWRSQAAAELDSGKHVDMRWDRCFVSETTQPGVAGRVVADISRERGKHPLDCVLDIALADELSTRVTINFANDDPDAVAALLQEPGCVLGLSDAGAHIGQICDAVMPLDFLAHWVRDRELMTAEAGIRRLTGELADLTGLHGRGYLTEGAAADVVVLDWEALDPGPTRRIVDFPAGGDRLVADAPRGLRHLLVNGTAIRRGDEPVSPGPRPGQLLNNRRDVAQPRQGAR
jgi:N-acyl-D-aspartate/D-glutamate deacylase